MKRGAQEKLVSKSKVGAPNKGFRVESGNVGFNPSSVVRTKGGHALGERQKFRQRTHLRAKRAREIREKTGGEAIREMIALFREGKIEWSQVQETIDRYFPGASRRKGKLDG